MPVAGKINVIPLEEKTSEEEPVVYATKMVSWLERSKLQIGCLLVTWQPHLYF